MAKRKRLDLSPATLGEAAPEARISGQTSPSPAAAIEPRAARGGLAAPIARIAGEAAEAAAFEAVSEELRRARAEGRLIQRLPLSAIEADHLVRDRLGLDEEELAPLLESLRARGQQTPIEVVALKDGRYGLVSGWRRLQALRRLAAEAEAAGQGGAGQGTAGQGGAAGGTVLALLRSPRDSGEAYVAMVEENEIRLGLSHYERARIVARSVEAGVFPDAREALNRLFGSGSRARRSKIGSFLSVVEALDGALRFPAAIGERLGLALAQALERDPGFGPGLRAALLAEPAPEAEVEQARLQQALRAAEPPKTPEAAPKPGPEAGAEAGTPATAKSAAKAGQEIAPGLRLRHQGRTLVLEGEAVTEELAGRLAAWLRKAGG